MEETARERATLESNGFAATGPDKHGKDEQIFAC
jgi:hypothetical protein